MKPKQKHEDSPGSERVYYPVAERDSLGALEQGSTRKETGRARVVVRITRYSTRSLDPDNLYGSVKPLLDCLRYAGLVANDTEEAINLQVFQDPVKTRKEHHTRIELIYDP